MATRGRSVPRREEKVDLKRLPDFTEQDIADLKEAFDVFDKKGTGLININDMIDFMEGLRIDKKYPTVFNLVESVLELQPSDGINYKEFLEGLQHYIGDTKTGDGIDRLFHLLDVGKHEFLDKERLRSLATELGERLTDEEVEELINNYFECPNGRVDMDAFYEMIIKNVH